MDKSNQPANQPLPAAQHKVQPAAAPSAGSNSVPSSG